LRGIAARVATGIAGAPPALVAVATDIAHHQHFMNSFRVTLWSFVTLAALLTGLLGWLAVRRGLAPLQAIRQETAGVTAQRLDFRLAVDRVPAELVALVETLNAMLARLEASFRQLSDFSSDLAHELRTPLSNLLTQTQVTLTRDRTVEAYREVLSSNVEEFERLSRMIADMLFLAKSEEALIVPHREMLELADAVGAVFEFYEALAEEKNISLSCTGSGEVSGDRMMLRRALSNLLSNAIRHTPPGGRISVRIVKEAAAVSLCVENQGETIGAEHLPRLFDRFYRVDPARQRNSEGAGLGLAITRAIMRAHGGSISVSSQDGLTFFQMHLPLNDVIANPTVR
jgi:two-component system heavy metal sensor histidine kinase CusS